jgi:uncharacterized protein (DUF302 family)
MMTAMMNGMMNSMSTEDKQDTMLKLMPQMMKSIKGSDVLELVSAQMSEMLFVTKKSRFTFDQTIQKIKISGEDFGWYRPEIQNRKEIELNFGYSDPNSVASVSMCIPRSAHDILKVNKKLAAMMPLQITIYEENNQTYICWLNIKMMGKLFGEKVAEIMGTASDDLLSVLKDIIIEEGE